MPPLRINILFEQIFYTFLLFVLFFIILVVVFYLVMHSTLQILYEIYKLLNIQHFLLFKTSHSSYFFIIFFTFIFISLNYNYYFLILISILLLLLVIQTLSYFKSTKIYFYQLFIFCLFVFLIHFLILKFLFSVVAKRSIIL